jgi:hypothetical protein
VVEVSKARSGRGAWRHLAATILDMGPLGPNPICYKASYRPGASVVWVAVGCRLTAARFVVVGWNELT